MTNLVERVRLDITLHRDEQPNFPFDNLAPGLRALSRRGRKRIGGMTIEWQKLGLEEVPEASGFDN